MTFTQFLALIFIALLTTAIIVPMFNAFFRMFWYSTEDDHRLRVNFKSDD